MKFEFFVSFESKENDWITNEPFQTIVEAVELSDNSRLLIYENGTILMHIELSDHQWHVYSNRPMDLDRVKDLNNKEVVRVNVIH